MAMMKKAKPKKDENQKALKKNETLSNPILWETGNKVESHRAQRCTLVFVEWVQVHSAFLARTE